MCFIESQTVDTCCPMFFVLLDNFLAKNARISQNSRWVFFSHLCIKSRIQVGLWDFWELFLINAIYTLHTCFLFHSCLAVKQTFAIRCDKTNKASQQKNFISPDTHISTHSYIFILVVFVLLLQTSFPEQYHKYLGHTNLKSPLN